MGEFSVFDGLEVEQVWVWYSLRLVFDLGPPGEPGTYFDVTEFDFVESGGTVHRINVETDPVAAGVVLAVLHRRVSRAAVTEWTLTLEFDSGARQVCQPDERWEAWTAQHPELSTAIYSGGPGDPGSPT